MKEYTHYNRIKSVLDEKNKTGAWLSEQMGVILELFQDG